MLRSRRDAPEDIRRPITLAEDFSFVINQAGYVVITGPNNQILVDTGAPGHARKNSPKSGVARTATTPTLWCST